MKDVTMSRTGFLKVTLLSGAAFALQGCVAAIVPIAAGGLLTGAAPAYEPSNRTEAEPTAARPANAASPPNENLAAPTQTKTVAQAETGALAPGTAAPDAVSRVAAPLIDEMASDPAPVSAPTAAPSLASAADIADTADQAEQSASELLPETMVQRAMPAADIGDDMGVELAVSEPETQVSASAIGTLTVAEPAADLAASRPASNAPVSNELESTGESATQAPSEMQVLRVDEGANFAADDVSDAASLSAADAAAALTTLPAAQEPAVDAATLARTKPAAATSVSTSASAAPITPQPEPQPVPQQVTQQAALLAQANPAPASRSLAAATPETAPPAALSAPVAAAAPMPTVSAENPAPNAITSLLSYANQRSFTAGRDRQSAMLADRFALTAERAPCTALDPVVLIDLDPKGALFSTDQAPRPPSGLGAGLAQLRASGVKIAWISGNPATAEDDIRDALMQSTLDLFGDDIVVLIRQPDQRKQTLREELAQTHCVIAIAGDEREDFDELYAYLLDSGDARSLEVLYGQGWFIIPQPIVTETPTP